MDVFLRGLAGATLSLKGIICGQGSLRADMETLALDLGLSDRVLFSGWIPHEDLWKIYNRMDVFVFPTMRRRRVSGMLR